MIFCFHSLNNPNAIEYRDTRIPWDELESAENRLDPVFFAFYGETLLAVLDLSWGAVVLFSELTEARVEHVERHPVAFLRASDCNETLVAVVLWFINLNHAATDLTDLVDLLAALPNDGSNHVIGDVDLLSKRGTGHSRAARHGLPMRPGGAVGAGGTGRVRLHVRTSSIAGGSMAAIGHGGSRVRVSLMGMAVLRRVRLGGHVVGSGIGTTAVVVLPVAKVAASRLRVVWDHLHTARNGTGGAAAASRVGGRGSATKTLVELL